MKTATQVRHDVAAALARRCPSNLGQEIALTGSVSRGCADEYSDIELNFWVAEMAMAERESS